LKVKKIEIRRREQVRSAEMFGLSHDRLTFLDLPEDERGTGSHSPETRVRMMEHLESLSPEIVMLPVGKDTNRTHVWVYEVFRDCAKDLVSRRRKPMVALYNEDPKTTEIRADLVVLFGERRAGWKGALLRAHDSQQQRNRNTRGMGFDERILNLNRLGYKRFFESFGPEAGSSGYAEVFELELFESP
jgi:hypothetical protein